MTQKELLEIIEQADDLFVSKIIDAVIKRYSLMFPDWEVMFLSYHKEPKVRTRDIDGHIRFLEKLKEMDPLE